MEAMVSNALFKRFYPDDRKDGTIAFYSWVRQSISPDTRLLNLGAGPATGQRIRSFRGEVAFVAGVDVDTVVLKNDELDQAAVIEDGRIPFADASFDVVVSDFVFEHVEHPSRFLGEAGRVLRPGGCLLFRTPSCLHYVSIVARLTPQTFHEKVANRVRKLPAEAHPPWPTFYRLNSAETISRYARDAGFTSFDFRFIEPEPSYLVFGALPFLLGVAWERAVNRFDVLSPVRANILGRLRKTEP